MDWEREFLHRITCLWHSESLEGLLRVVQMWQVGVLLLLLAVAVVALGRPARALRALVAAGIGVGLALLLGTGIWYAVGRERPQLVYEQILRTPEELATCAEHPEALALRTRGSSRPAFPSHHALTSGAFATALLLASGPVGALAWLAALLVGWDRLHSGKHWPTDVLAGYAIGAFLAWAAWTWAPRALRLLGPGAVEREPAPPDASSVQG